MKKQVLIYGKVVPVNKKMHADLSVKAGDDFEFARTVNSVPLMAVEFQSAATVYPIVFAGDGDKVVPVVVLGARAQENAFLSREGKMDADYIPAFLRRYPFVFSSSDDGKNFTLCIDEGYSGCNKEGRGERLFDADGEQTQYLKSIVDFLQHYQAHHARTEDFCKKLIELNLLETMGAQITPVGGQQITLSGFKTINRERLKALSGEQLRELAQADLLELIYIHLQSIRNFTAIGDKMKDSVASELKENSTKESQENAVEALD